MTKKNTTPKLKRNTKNKPKSSKPLRHLKFLPALVITVISTFLWAQPQFLLNNKSNDVLAYATDTSSAGLLASTNSQRSANGVGTLSIASKLNSAAQAKANDMVTRNYWSHQTPDGEQPWIFIAATGYQYLSAGENLAYGFSNSSATITGWMNSPSHKANLLNAVFTEVGFGIANSPNFVNNGAQTVVVAMYAKPASPAPVATPAPTATPAPKQTAKPKSTPAANPKTETPATPVETPVAVEPSPEPIKEEEKPKEEAQTIAYADTGDGSGQAEETKSVNRIQLLTGGNAVWSTTMIVAFVCSVGSLWLIHRGFRFKKWLKASEKFVGSHIHLDLTVLSIVFLGFVLLSTSGFIR